MNPDATIIFIASVAIAIASALVAYKGRNESLPQNRFFGIRTNTTRQSEETWVAAHRAAAPLNSLTAVCFGLTAVVAGFVTNSPRGASISLLVGWSAGLLSAGGAIFVAGKAANKVLRNSG